jgi:hypothetical protein
MHPRYLRRALTRAFQPARVLRRKTRRAAALAKRNLRLRVIDPYVLVRLLPRKVEHVHGPEEIVYAPDELLVLCRVRNGEPYVRSFIDHYASLGVKNIVFLDNGSSDRTVELLCEYDVTVLQTDAPYRRYGVVMNLYLMERFSRDRWCLLADIDEFFDYPYSDTLDLRDFLRYLNEHHYTGVLTQVLDMFSSTPVGELSSRTNESISAAYTLYDVASIQESEYRWPGLSNPQIKWHFGGVRSRVFETNNSLTKPALLFHNGDLGPLVEVHHVKGARIADISCLVRHYPFVNSFHAKVEEAVRSKRHPDAAWDYAAYWRVLEHDPNPNLSGPFARVLTSTEQLIDEGFLVVTEDYRRWVATHPRPSSG